MKKRMSWLGMLLLCLFVVFSVSTSAYVKPKFKIYSEATLLYNQNADVVVFAENHEKRMYPASLTKIMSAVVVIEQVKDLNRTVTITSKMLDGLTQANASVAGFVVGEELNIKELLYGLLLPSGGDAANALALVVSGSMEAFVAEMNQVGSRLNLQNTNFENATGLDHSNQYTTASDLLTIVKHAMTYDVFRQISATDSITIVSNKHPQGLTLYSSMLYGKEIQERYYSPYLIGGKTGYTGKAGRCLISYGSFEGVEYLLISLNAPFEGFSSVSRSFLDAKEFYQWAYDRFYVDTFANKGDSLQTMDIKLSWQNQLELEWPSTVKVLLDRYTQESVELKSTIPTSYVAPIEKMQSVGEVMLYYQSVPIYTQTIVSPKTVKQSILLVMLDGLRSFLYRFRFIFGILLMLVFLVFGYRSYRLAKIRRNRARRSQQNKQTSMRRYK